MINNLLVIISSFFPAQKADTGLTISHLEGDFYVYTTYQSFQGRSFPANGMYVVTDSGVVLIDGPWDRLQALPLIDSIQQRHHKPVVLCIATHYHDDRTGSFDILEKKGIRTFSSRQTLLLCKEKNEKQAALCFDKDTTFRLGSLELNTFYPGHGHTPDNIVIWFPASRILYGGCFIKSTDAQDMGNMADASTDQWIIAIRKVMKKYPDARHIIPGHFSWDSTKSIAHTKKLLKKYKKENG